MKITTEGGSALSRSRKLVYFCTGSMSMPCGSRMEIELPAGSKNPVFVMCPHCTSTMSGPMKHKSFYCSKCRYAIHVESASADIAVCPGCGYKIVREKGAPEDFAEHVVREGPGQKIIDRIKRLIALAEDQEGTDEGATAMSMAHRLMVKHQVEAWMVMPLEDER